MQSCVIRNTKKNPNFDVNTLFIDVVRFGLNLINQLTQFNEIILSHPVVLLMYLISNQLSWVHFSGVVVRPYSFLILIKIFT